LWLFFLLEFERLLYPRKNIVKKILLNRKVCYLCSPFRKNASSVGRKKIRNEKGAQKKFEKKFAKQKKVSTFAARFAKTGTQSIDILKTSSKPTRFRKEER